jgi:broad specificity phosphatase PhoE
MSPGASQCFQVRGQSRPDDAEDLEEFWARTSAAFERLRLAVSEAGPSGDEGNVVVVGHAAVMSALLCHALGLGPEALPLFR